MREEERAAAVPVSGGSVERVIFPGGEYTPLVVLGGVETGLRYLAGTERILAQRWHGRTGLRPVIVLGRPLASDPADTDRMGHPRQMAAAVAEVLDAMAADLEGPVAIEAESGGGRIALWLAIERPELIERLVLVSVASETPPPMAGALRSWLTLAEAGRWNEFFADAASALRPVGEPAPPAPAGAAAFVPAPATPERFIAELRATLDPSSFVTDRLDEIRAPALVLAGGRDAVVPPDATRVVAERMPSARFEIDEECGHAVRTSFAGYEWLVEDFLAS